MTQLLAFAVLKDFPSQRNNNTTIRVLKTPKTESNVSKIFIPKRVAQYLSEIKAEQNDIIEALGNE